MLWSYDLIGGAVPGNEMNALLSEAAKTWMYRMHTDGGCATPLEAEEGALAWPCLCRSSVSRACRERWQCCTPASAA